MNVLAWELIHLSYISLCRQSGLPMTYSRMICDESSTMSMAGVDGLTWAGAPNQACTPTMLPLLNLPDPRHLVSTRVSVPLQGHPKSHEHAKLCM